MVEYMSGLILSISDKFLFIAALLIKSSGKSKMCSGSLFFAGWILLLFIFNKLSDAWMTAMPASWQRMFYEAFFATARSFR
ncbi:hypothetical protein AFK62_15385 [Cronobacter condimenti 1330]|uniref:Uncharacterized protein n=1 Tax=Cronobacter condimenti 1330 TaxID=1073999 RepID=A0ABN4IB66_9ENTR|nr:hypothetical protein AFK62_15385 [Cronobacter condimenti 1330]